MSIADPWDEAPRLERVLEAELMRQAERSALYTSAEEFCERRCRTEGRCRYVESKPDCPLWLFLRTAPHVP